MATPDLPAPRNRRALMELVGILLMVAGTIGLVTCAFTQDYLLGWAALSLVAIVVGFVVSYDW